MSVLRTHAAAAMLGVSPNTLRSWERRFGYPTPRRTQGGHRQFDLAEIEALRQAFEETHNVSSAISIARERGSGPSSPTRLRSALRRFEELEADRILEESLAVRSVHGTDDEVLLPAVRGLGRAPGRGCLPARRRRSRRIPGRTATRRAGLRLALGHRLARRRQARRT